MKKILALLLAAMMLALCVPVVALPAEEEVKANEVGTDISAVRAPYLLAGGQLSTTDFLTIEDISAHPLTLITMWSEECYWCKYEMPFLQQLHEEYGDTVLVVGCGTTLYYGTAAGEASYFASHGYTYMSVFMDTVLHDLHYANGFTPQSFLVNSDGIVVEFLEGAVQSYEELLEVLAPWLSEVLDEQHTVSFVDGVTNEVFETQTVNMFGRPVYPEPPVHEGYTFNRWNPERPPMITEDTVITATYTINTYRVRFYDSITGEKISQKYVQYGSPVVPPDAPEHEGYTFVGWDHDLSFVSQAMDVYTIYSFDGGILGDVTGDGNLDTTDALQILRYASGLIELDPTQLALADYNGDGVVDSADALAILRAI